MSKIIRFSGYDCLVVKNNFNNNNQICLSLVGADTEHNKEMDVFPHEPIAKASVNLEGVKVGENQTIIKDYAENRGILKILLHFGLVKETGVAIELPNDNLAYIVDVLI